MTDSLSANTQAVLLLTAPLIVGRRDAGAPAPLSAGEYNRLARGLRDRGREPADLLTADDALAPDDCPRGIERERIDLLLGRGFLLGQALERWRARGIWVVGRTDAGYPQRLRERLGAAAPPLLYGFGERYMLEEGGLAVVGSRNAGDAGLAFAESAGRLAAEARRSLISGGARGVDRAAMRGALDSDGRAVSVLADGLERAVMRRGDRDMLMDGRLVLVCPEDPAARFQVWRAMSRNKLIYALADAALVVSADDGKGGTWAGAVEQLEKFRRTPVYVRPAGENGLDELRKRGARSWPEHQTPEALEDLLDAPPPVEAAKEALLPGLQEAPAGFDAEPATALFKAVLNALARICGDDAKSSKEIALALGATQAQTAEWIERALLQGALKKIPRHARYLATAPGAAPAGNATEADDFSATVRKLVLAACAREQQSEGAIAKPLGVRKHQARVWLSRMVSDGLLKRHSGKTIRYGALVKQARLFDCAASKVE